MRFLRTTFLVSLFTIASFAKLGTEVASSRKVVPTRQHQVSHREPAATGRGGWLASGGIGLWLDPTLFLLSPQLEYAMRHNFYIGPLVQLGIGSGTIFTGSFTGRYIFSHSKVQPSVEFGLGLGFGSGGAVGLHIPIGIGMDYQLESGISLGTMIRGNFLIGSSFANTFSVSWPILVGRFAI